MTAREAILMLTKQLQYRVDNDKNSDYTKRLQDAINALLKMYHGQKNAEQKSKELDDTIEDLRKRDKLLMVLLGVDPDVLKLPYWYLSSYGDVPIEDTHRLIFNYDAICKELDYLESIGQMYQAAGKDQDETQTADIRKQIYSIYSAAIDTIYALLPYPDKPNSYIEGRIKEINTRYRIDL